MNGTNYEDFNKLVEQFNRMGFDETASLGASGLMAQQRKAMEENTDAMNRLADNRDSLRRGSSPIVRPQSQDMDGDFESLADQLATRTFTVRVDNAIVTIVDPLFRRMGILAADNHLFQNDLHNEHMTAQGNIIRGLGRLSEGTETGLRSLYLSYREFMRFPVWNTLKTVAGFMTKSIGGILFGFKEQKSDTDRIVDAINKQTEFMRTGSIDNEDNFFVRMFRQGALGMAARGVGRAALSATTGISRNRAQERENNRASGQDDNGLVARLSTRLFANSIVQRGTKAGASGGLDVDEDLTIKEQIKSEVSAIKGFVETSSKYQQFQAASMARLLGISDLAFLQDSRFKASIIDHDQTQREFWERAADTLESMDGSGKAQVKWLKRLRDGQVMATIMRGASLALQGIRTILGGIATAVSTIAGAIAASKMFGRFRKGAPGADIPDIDGNRRRKPNMGKKGFFGRLIESGKAFFQRNGAKVAQGAKNALPHAKNVMRVGGPAIAAGLSYEAGKRFAPARSFHTPNPNDHQSASSTIIRENNDMVMPNDNFTKRVNNSNQKQSSGSILERLDDFFNRDLRAFFSSSGIKDTSDRASESIRAKADQTVPKLQEVSNRVMESSRKQIEEMTRQSEDTKQVLKSIDDSMKRLVKNTDKSNDETASSVANAFGNLSLNSVFGD